MFTKGKGEKAQVPNSPDITGSTSINAKDKSYVLARDNRCCIVCKQGPGDLEVAHIVAKATRSNWLWHWIQGTNLDGQFKKNDTDNIMTLCMAHYNSFNEFSWILAPSPKTLDWLIKFEREDWQQRTERLLQERKTDPNACARARQVPTQEDWEKDPERYNFHYIPLHFAGAVPHFNRYRCEASAMVIVNHNPDSDDEVGDFPQTLLFRELELIRPLRETGSTSLQYLNGRVLFNVNLYYSDKYNGPWGLRLNPFALIANALSAIYAAFCPPLLRIGVKGDKIPLQMKHPIEAYEEKLSTLRRLYNRTFPDVPDRSSNETVRPLPRLQPLNVPGTGRGSFSHPSTSSYHPPQYQGQYQSGNHGTRYKTLEDSESNKDPDLEETLAKDMKALTVM